MAKIKVGSRVKVNITIPSVGPAVLYGTVVKSTYIDHKDRGEQDYYEVQLDSTTFMGQDLTLVGE